MNLCEGVIVPPPTPAAVERAKRIGVDPEVYMAGVIHLCLHPEAERRAVALEILESRKA